MRPVWTGVGAIVLAMGAPAIPASSHGGAGAFATGRYRNLFAEQLGTAADASHAKIERAFQQLFHGDGQEERVYFETGANRNGTLAYITDWANNDARTEGMSYGMMIAVQLGHKREFDALWNWSKTYMQVTDPKNPSVGYFAWSLSTDGTPRSTGAAPDGEEYYAMALLFAAHRWGNGGGIYNYQAEAEKILRGMRHHPLLTGTPPFRIHPGDPPFVPPDKPWPSPNNRREAAEAAAQGKPWPPAIRFNRSPRPVTVGPMVDEASNMIRFVPETNIPGTDASYHLPAFYELWARWGPPEDRAFWARAADVSREFFQKVTAPNTGLAPDRSNFDGTPATVGTASPRNSATTAGGRSRTGRWITAGGATTIASRSGVPGFSISLSVREFTPSPIALRPTASRSRAATRPAWSRRRRWAASPRRRGRSRRRSSVNSGPCPSPRASSAILTACST